MVRVKPLGSKSKSRQIANDKAAPFAMLLVMFLACYSSMYMGLVHKFMFIKRVNKSETLASDTAYLRGSDSSASTVSNPRHKRSKNTTYIQLPLPNESAPAITYEGCCGIGHRLSRNIPTMVYAISNSRPVIPDWSGSRNVAWDVLFNDTAQIKKGPAAKEIYGNGYPANWSSSPLAYTGQIAQPERFSGTTYAAYDAGYMKPLFEMPLAHSIIMSLSENLSSLVLSFLEPMRKQYLKSELHFCVHVREGNNETGDWAGKTWRHIELGPILNATLLSMKSLAEMKNAKKVSMFVASDSTKARPWFEENVPVDWHVVKPAKELPRPENGVWFGQHGSPTNANLTRDGLDEAMAEAVADVFALGECDALYIPNYSSFSVVGIILTRAERNKVFFLSTEEGKPKEYMEYP